MTDKQIINALDGADVFLRNRANSKPAPLNEYDIAELLDIAKICDKASNIIKQQQKQLDNYSNNVRIMSNDARKYITTIMDMRAEIDRLKDKYEVVYQPIAMVKAEAKAEAYKEFANSLIAELDEFYCEECRIDTLIEERLQERVGDDMLEKTADFISRKAYEQVKWERDTAIEQLKSYGVSLFEDADVVKVVRCKECVYANEKGDTCYFGEGRFVTPEHYCSNGERKCEE
jgi:hypothetical protein